MPICRVEVLLEPVDGSATRAQVELLEPEPLPEPDPLLEQLPDPLPDPLPEVQGGQYLIVVVGAAVVGGGGGSCPTIVVVVVVVGSCGGYASSANDVPASPKRLTPTVQSRTAVRRMWYFLLDCGSEIQERSNHNDPALPAPLFVENKTISCQLPRCVGCHLTTGRRWSAAG